jgi:hypothetical protein
VVNEEQQFGVRREEFEGADGVKRGGGLLVKK